MKVSCVSPRGFCYGVRRAIEMVEDGLRGRGEGEMVYMTEDIIHNKIFMKNMKEKGVIKVDSIEDVPEGKVVVVSAHGVPPSYYEICRRKKITVIDSTCPIVRNIQNSIKKSSEKSKKIILIGHKRHAEVIGMMGYAGRNNIFVVENIADLENIPHEFTQNVVYFTQTTLEKENTNEIVRKLKEKIPNIETEGSKTCICNATSERQNALREAIIKDNPEIVIIVGSGHSSNVNRLVEVAKFLKVRSVLRVDSEDDLKGLLLEGNTVVVMSGASTPEFLVEGVVKYMSEIN